MKREDGKQILVDGFQEIQERLKRRRNKGVWEGRRISNGPGRMKRVRRRN